MYKFITIILVMFMLSGCASVDKYLETRVTCTVAKDEARVDSKWGPFGISSKVAEADIKEICK